MAATLGITRNTVQSAYSRSTAGVFVLLLAFQMLSTMGCDSADPGGDATLATVSGHVYRVESSTPLSGATVTIGGASTTTDASGAYMIANIPNGTQEVTVALDTFSPHSSFVVVQDGENTMDIDLIPIESTFRGIEFVHIAPGTFRMGFDDTTHPEERPAHDVTLTNDIWMSRYEVTQGQYRAITGASPSSAAGDDRLPVEQVTWFDAIEFANGLSAAEGLTACYGADGSVQGGIYRCEGYRLPTEAEWEYATRAGTTTRWSFGDDLAGGAFDNHAWNGFNAGDHCHVVGTRAPNPWGLYDVHGNVWEWTNDWHEIDYYQSSPAIDPPGPGSGLHKSARGGSYIDGDNYHRSSYRTRGLPTYYSRTIGFRLVRTIH